MKALIFGLLVLSTAVHAESPALKRVYKKTGANTAVVTITTKDTTSTQASMFVDAKENAKFIADLLKDPTSELAKLVKEIELENCEATSTPQNTYIDGCGEVTITPAVRTSYARGGWMSAGASYTMFVGFTNAGTGSFFSVTRTVTISEDAEANSSDQGSYSGVVVKSLSLDSVKKLEVAPQVEGDVR